ncbi:MAG: hypothetical protein P8M11_03135 [Planctomycetota bacterium]|nr:hypothetical protein [Planctomycetota bacterium]MDG1983537.1 hypothetical protein [Planctomycetota bacterium]
MSSTEDPRGDWNPLDRAVAEAMDGLRTTEVGAPEALLLLATGPGDLPARMDAAVVVPLREVPGVPEPWHGVTLRAGNLGETRVWLIEDDPTLENSAAPDWSRAFPVWLAGAAGAQLMIHTSAGTALQGDGSPPMAAGDVVRLVDHLNLSGRSPLRGLGESRVGPLFPDQTRVHDRRLAEVVSTAAAALSVQLRTGVAACTSGPALCTPAELAWHRTAGCDVSVQRLGDPLIAAAHAGMGSLALVAVTDVAGEHDLDVATIVARAQETAPVLDQLVETVAKGLGPLARERAAEVEA